MYLKMNLEFLKSTKEPINDDYRSYLFVGKTNVGKSSTINFLAKSKKIAYSSKKPGKTQLLNYYVDHSNKIYIIDSPGYGYSKISKNIIKDFGNFIDNFFNNILTLECVYLLINSDRIISKDDLLMIDFLKSKKIRIFIIASKYDRLNQSDKHHLKIMLENLNIKYYLHSNSINKYNNYDIISDIIKNNK